jgi:hypothetical protein
MRHPILPLTLLPLHALSACRSREGEMTANPCPVPRAYVENVSLCLPDGWSQNVEPFGEQGSFIISIRTEAAAEPSMQIHVKKESLEEPVLSHLAFAERAVALSRERAPGYSAVSTDPIIVSGKETVFHVFDAQPAPDGPTVRYYQFVTTNGNLAYGFTAVITQKVSEEIQRALLDLLRSVQFT